MNKYIPMPGARVSVTQARVIGNELDRICKEHGCAKPEILVEESRPVDAPLHPHFTWDDTEAAEKWRVSEARTIIRSVRIVKQDVPHQEQPVVRAFPNVQAYDKESRFEGSAYIPMSRVVRNKHYKQQVLDAAKRELREWQSRYQDYESYFGSVFKAIEEVTA